MAAGFVLHTPTSDFVDLGTDKAGFLYVNDISFDPESPEKTFELSYDMGLHSCVVCVHANEDGERRVPVRDLYKDDGIDFTTLPHGELITALHLPPRNGWNASYRKLRRRSTFDFPVLGYHAQQPHPALQAGSVHKTD